MSNFFPGFILNTRQSLFGLRHVLVFEDENLGARQSSTVDDGSVIQLVGDDEVVLAQDGGNRACIGGESGLKDHAGFDILEASDLFFELHVDLHGTGNRAHRA